MEQWFQPWLKIPTDHLLRNAIGDRGHSQRSRPAIRLRNIHPPDRWRHITPRGQSVPELIEIGGKPFLEVPDRLSVYASRSLVGLDPFVGVPNLSLRDVKRLCLMRLAHPVTGWPGFQTRCRRPFG